MASGRPPTFSSKRTPVSLVVDRSIARGRTMRLLFLHRGLRLIFIANLVSMIGTGMNTAAVTWFILQATHSEMSLSTLVVLQTVPALLMLPFTGVIIDREDRRHLIMLLDAWRGVMIFAVALLAIRNQVLIWHLYALGTLVAAGFWMFWPTITALIQELSPESEFVGANTMLLAGVQGGWMIAGAIVGFVYERIHLGGVLAIDAATYAVSLVCYFAVRKGKVTAAQRDQPHDLPQDAWTRYWHELNEGIHYLRGKPYIVLLGISWALFIAGMSISSSMMEMVPKHFMGRVQNTFYFLGTCLQLVTSIGAGAVAYHLSLPLAFAIIGLMYGIAALTAAWPVAAPAKIPQESI